MDKTGMYDYGVINEGGYFGDISVLLNQPSEFSFFYNPHSGKPVMLLSLPSETFMSICDDYPVVKEILVARAHKRKEMFENYKSILLIKYMKTIEKNYELNPS